MSFRRPSTPFVLLTLGVLFVLFHFYGHVLRAPNSVLFSSEGDGLKNYYTYAWHVQHDPDLVHYRGSNHPYGEHVFYTDGNPMLGWLVRMVPSGANYAVGLLNLALVFGLLLCAWCLYALLREFNVPPWAAALGGFSLMMLQPQLARMGGHLSLAHAWMIPLVWLLTLRSLNSKDPWRWALASTLTSIAIYFTHPYMGLMIGIFQASLLGLVLLTRWRSHWKQPGFHGRALLQVVIPVLLFLLILNTGAEHADRPQSPGGADLYATRFLSLIVPTHAPLGTPMHEFFKFEALEWETWCYLGLSSILMLIVVAAVQVGRWTWKGTGSHPLDLVGLSLAAGSVVLLFAMGEFTDLLGQRVPMLNQFRGTGRFAWVFWFACGIFCTVRLYHYLFAAERSVRRPVAVFVYVALVGFYAVEGWDFHKLFALGHGQAPNVFKAEHLPGSLAELVDAADEAEAVAIIPLPFVHVGSEYYQRDSRAGVMGMVYPLAFHTALPLMNGVTSRTSLSETRYALALLSPPEFPKVLGREFKKEARFIVAWSREELDDDERRFLAHCTPLLENDQGVLLSITAKDLFQYDGQRRLREYDEYSSAWMPCGTLLLSSHSTAALEDDCTRIFSDPDGMVHNGVVRDYTKLLIVPEHTLESDSVYELSFLFRALDPKAVNVWLVMEHYTAKGDDGVWEELKTITSMPMQFDGRTVASLSVRIDHPEKIHTFFLKGPDESFDRFEVEHVLLRPLGIDAWRNGDWQDEHVLFRNNIPLSPSADRATGPSEN